MAPIIPAYYKGQRESKRFSSAISGYSMGKKPKVSRNRSAVETVAESEGFDCLDRVDTQDACAPSRKSISLNVDGFVLPMQVLSVSKMSSLERRKLGARLRVELEQVRKLQRKIASSRSDGLGKKKAPSGKNVPRTNSGAAAVRKNEIAKQNHPSGSNVVALMKQCEMLLTRLLAHQHAWIFNEPVDIVKHKIPDYFNIIKHPMDLGTVRKKLLSNQYSHPMEFAADVRLTFKNAMTYNPPGHDVYYMAEVMSKHFEVRWKPIERKIPPIVDESPASKMSDIIEPENAYVPVPPAKKQKTMSSEKKVKHERDKRVMSDIDKQKLGMELEELLEDMPDNILNFLKESTSNGGVVSEDEIEIDIDSLSDDTLFTLRKLMDYHLMEKKRKEAVVRPSENEMQNESRFSNLPVQPCEESADEEVDICGNEPPPISSSFTGIIEKDAVVGNSNVSPSSSSDSGSSSSDTDSESSSASETDDANNLLRAVNVNEPIDARAEKESALCELKSGEISSGHNEQISTSNSSSTDLNCRQQGENAALERHGSPEKQFRAALLRSRFADIIIKAQENSLEKRDKPDAEKLKLGKEELERRRREEKARLQAEAKAAEAARMKAEVEAAAEAKRRRELEREAARQALQKMEKTVDIDENSQFMEDLEMFRSAPDEQVDGFMVETSPENSSQNGLGSFKFRVNSNPLEQLGLYMKNDEVEEDDNDEPESVLDA